MDHSIARKKTSICLGEGEKVSYLVTNYLTTIDKLQCTLKGLPQGKPRARLEKQLFFCSQYLNLALEEFEARLLKLYQQRDDDEEDLFV